MAYGDLNADNSIDIADAVLMYSYISGHKVTVGFEADLTRDGMIDAFDMAAMRKNLTA
ncbi:MAG: dockerin type I domain-containing protein [Ruminococcus sp.]|nr:dockerin type I domain-containing protein [Ruminococcus sp.]